LHLSLTRDSAALQIHLFTRLVNTEVNKLKHIKLSTCIKDRSGDIERERIDKGCAWKVGPSYQLSSFVAFN